MAAAIPARRLARLAGRRPAGPHVLHGGAEPGLQGRGARSGRDEPGRQRGRPSHRGRLPRPARPGGPGGRWPRPPPPNSRTCRPPRSNSWPALRASRPRRQASRSRRTGSARRSFLSGHGFAVAPFAVLRDDGGRGRRRRAAAARHREERAARLRRQGPGARAHARRRRGRVARRWAASPACSSRLVALAREVSVIVARNERGETATWPVAENHHRDGILDVSIVPARVSGATVAERRATSRPRSRRRSTTAACCAWKCSSRRTARCSSTKSRRARTTAATTRSTPASRRSSSNRRACWPTCRSATRASTRRP